MDIKICGLTNTADAQFAIEAGADYLGFVLYPDSPRGITVGALAKIRETLLQSIPLVAVMVNPSVAAAREAVEVGGAAFVQVHGAVDHANFVDFPYPLWRAVRAGGSMLDPEPRDWPAERYLVDAAVPGQHGGTGVRADWRVAARLASKYPVMLAGGLTPEVVAEAIGVVRPAGVDVSSGVEGLPGRKDHALVRAFIQAARTAAA